MWKQTCRRPGLELLCFLRRKMDFNPEVLGCQSSERDQPVAPRTLFSCEIRLCVTFQPIASPDFLESEFCITVLLSACYLSRFLSQDLAKMRARISITLSRSLAGSEGTCSSGFFIRRCSPEVGNSATDRRVDRNGDQLGRGGYVLRIF